MRAARGFRHGTRKKLKKKIRDKFKPEDYIRTFKDGEKVALSLEPASQKGMPHPRFKGKVGTVMGKRGRSYIVTFHDGGKEKTVIAKPEHLRAIKGFK